MIPYRAIPACLLALLPAVALCLPEPGAAVLSASAHKAKASTQAGTKGPAAASVAAAPITPADVQRLQGALAALDRGELQAAQPVLLELAGKYTGNAEIQTAAGMSLAEQGHFVEAVPLLERAHRLVPGNADVTQNLAVALLGSGSAGRASVLLKGLVQQHGKLPELRVSLAQAQMAGGEPSAAADSFAAAAALLQAQGQPAGADLRHDCAVALLAARRAPEATAVLAASPDAGSSASTEALLGEAEEQGKHFQEAVSHFRRAAELDPSEPNLYAYGNELLQHWTFPAAAEVFRYATGRFPSSERLQMALGIALFGNSTYDKAVPVFAELLSRQPNLSAAADLLGRSCNALAGAQQPGCAALRHFAEAHPDNAPASLYAAVAILHQPADTQDTTGAERLLRNALRVDPRLAEAWYQLAVLQQSGGDWQGSSASLQQALTLQPEYPEAHYRMARAYSHLGKREEAASEIALQQKYAAANKAAENKRMQEVMTFLITSN